MAHHALALAQWLRWQLAAQADNADAAFGPDFIHV